MKFLEKVKIGLKNPNNFKNYYLHLWDLRNRPTIKKARFVRAQIEPTTRCNLSCKMCLHSAQKMQKSDMNFGQFEKIINQLPCLDNLVLQGLGEPLLNPELFLMIKEAKKRKMRVGLTTNATLLNEENGRKILESGLDWMYISIDAATKEEYENIRVGANFEKTIENIKNFLEMKGNKKPETGFWSLILKNTFSEAGKIIDLAENIGIKKIVFQNAIHNWGKGDPLTCEACGGEVDMDKFINDIKSKKTDIEIEINLNKKEGGKCNWPWNSLYITVDGFATPCCMEGSDPKVINFGNVFETPIKEIMNNQKYQNFRKKLCSDSPPEICRNCPVYYNQDIISI